MAYDYNAMCERIHNRCMSSKLGLIINSTPNLKWIISGDYGYQSIKNNGIEFRLFSSGKLVLLKGYDPRYGAWGDYTERIEVDNIEDIVKKKGWLDELLCSPTKHNEATIVMY